MDQQARREFARVIRVEAGLRFDVECDVATGHRLEVQPGANGSLALTVFTTGTPHGVSVSLTRETAADLMLRLLEARVGIEEDPRLSASE